MSYQGQQSSPIEMRLAIGVKENDLCTINIESCIVMGPLTYEVNGDVTNVTCFDHKTKKSVVIARIEGAATQSVTFDLSRHLPQAQMSKFLQWVRDNCSLRLYLLRSTECADLLNPLDFEVIGIFGDITSFGNYSTTDLIARDKPDAAIIEESTTVTCELYTELGNHIIASRDPSTTAPIISITNLDTKSCGGNCDDDSDGCQVWASLEKNYIANFSSNLYGTSIVLPIIVPTPLTPISTEILKVGKKVVVLGKGVANEGILHYTTITDFLTGTPTWTEILLDSSGTALTELNAGVSDGNVAWLVSEQGDTYQYNSIDNTITLVNTVPGISTALKDIDLFESTIVIAGDGGVVLRSSNGGKSFQQITVIDPITSSAFVGNISSVGIYDGKNWAVGTVTGRILYTTNNGTTWKEQLVEVSGNITDLAFAKDGTNVGYASVNNTTEGFLLLAPYGFCEQMVELPRTSDPLPANIGLNTVAVCPFDHNIVLAGGEITGGTGIVLVGTVDAV